MRDYFGLFLVLAGLLGILTWARFSPRAENLEAVTIAEPKAAAPQTPAAEEKTTPAVKSVPRKNVSKAKRAEVVPSTPEANATEIPANDTLANGIFEDAPKSENAVTALGIPVEAYLKDQKTRFPHAKVYQQGDDRVRLFVQCWEMKDPSPNLLSSMDCQKVLARKRVDTAVRVY